MRPPMEDLDKYADRSKNVPQRSIYADLIESLDEGITLVESAYAHVSHGGPTLADAEAWIRRAKKARNSLRNAPAAPDPGGK